MIRIISLTINFNVVYLAKYNQNEETKFDIFFKVSNQNALI